MVSAYLIMVMLLESIVLRIPIVDTIVDNSTYRYPRLIYLCLALGPCYRTLLKATIFLFLLVISIPNRSSYPNFSHNNNNTSTRFNFYTTDWNQFTYQVVSLLEPFTLEYSPLNNYNKFVNVLLCATKKSTPLKCINKKKYSTSPP